MPSDESFTALLCTRTWRFGHESGPTIATELSFGPNGVLQGHASNDHLAWRLENGALEILDAYGKPSARFAETVRSPSGTLELRGHSLHAPQPALVLRESAKPPPAPPKPVARRNLVLMRAGDHALFPFWRASESRTWDLAVSCYGEGTPDWGQDYFVAEKGPKWRPIHRWVTANPQWFDQYDYFWFPDDDIMTDWQTVETLFALCRRYRLQLAQAALTPESHIWHAVTRRQPGALLRYTNFVESMVPVLSAPALRLCLPVLAEDSRFGWGIDWVMPKLLGYPPAGIAIVDACAVTHTRPARINTDTAAADAELRLLTGKYGVTFADHRVLGCIFGKPQPADVALP